MPQQWASIACRAATLEERLAAYRLGKSSDVKPAGPADRWLRVAADGDVELFLARLESLGIAPTDLPDCLADPATVDIPDYLICLIEVADGRGQPSTIDELVSLLVEWAQRRVVKSPAVAWQSVAIAGASEHLRQHLTSLVAPCWDRLVSEGRVGDGIATELVWVEFPVLARQVGVAVQRWIERTDQFLAWLAADRVEIRRVFDVEVDRLSSVEFGLSDPHAGQATVARLRFSNGSAVIFKPKSVAAENALAAIWQLLNCAHDQVNLPTYPVLDCGDHGWVQAVDHDARGDHEFLSKYYHQCGALTAAVYALGGTDCTTENVIANSRGPLLIDAETVLHPVLAPDGVPDSDSGEVRARDLVVDTMMLPRWLLMAGSPIDVSALGAASSGEIVAPGLAINSSTQTGSGELAKVADYLPSFLAGFRAGWTAAASVPADAVAEAFSRSITFRALVRTTDLYVRLLRSSRDPAVMTDGLTYSLHFERLARLAATKLDRRQAFALADAERHQLEVGDIPIFGLAPTDRDVRSSEGVVVSQCALAPIEHATASWSRLTETNFVRQQDIATAAITVGRVDRSTWSGMMPDAIEGPPSAAGQGETSGLVANALDRLAWQVTRQLHQGYAEGLVTVGSTRWGVGRNDPFLDDGRAGIGLALLATSRVLPNDQEFAAVGRELLLTSMSELETRAGRWRQMRVDQFASLVGRTATAWRTAAEIASDADLAEALTCSAASVSSFAPTAPAGLSAPLLADRSDTYWSGVAGTLERTRCQGSIDGEYWLGLRALATRVLRGTLNVAVPPDCPLLPLGFHRGVSGIMFALAAGLASLDPERGESAVPGVTFW